MKGIAVLLALSLFGCLPASAEGWSFGESWEQAPAAYAGSWDADGSPAAAENGGEWYAAPEIPAAEQAPDAAPAADAGISLEERVERAVERCLAAREAPYVMAGGGSFAAAPPRRARTLEEAGRLAQELFRK